MKQEKERLNELEEFFHLLEAKTQKYQRYFAALATLPSNPIPKPISVEYGNSSVSRKEIENARLESNLRRDSE